MYPLLHLFNYENSNTSKTDTINQTETELPTQQSIDGPSSYHGREHPCSNCFSWTQKIWEQHPLHHSLKHTGTEEQVAQEKCWVSEDKMWAWDSTLTVVTTHDLVWRQQQPLHGTLPLWAPFSWTLEHQILLDTWTAFCLIHKNMNSPFTITVSVFRSIWSLFCLH